MFYILLSADILSNFANGLYPDQVINEKESLFNWHYFKLMTVNNSVTNVHQVERYGHVFPMNIKKEH